MEIYGLDTAQTAGPPVKLLYICNIALYSNNPI